MLQSHAGDWALCSEVGFDCRLVFDDAPSISEALERCHGIRLHSKAALLGPFVRTEGISESDIKYWKPQTLGEALFNWWD